MIKLKLMILFIMLITVSGCTEFALIVSGASIAGTQNAYARAYSSIDILTLIQTDKGIKKHIYDTIKTNRSTKEGH